MSDWDVDPDAGLDADLDVDLDVDGDGVDANAGWGVVDDVVVVDGGIDLDQAPDPLSASDVPPVRFGETVEFPDGTTVEDPNTDALGNVYPTRSDYLGGTNAHVPDE